MTASISQAKSQLKTQLEKLMQEKYRLEQEDPYLDQNRLSDNAASDTEAAEEEGHFRTQAVVEELDGSIDRVKWALERVESGKWGECERCGREIEEGRLRLDWANTLCSKCAQETEE